MPSTTQPRQDLEARLFADATDYFDDQTSYFEKGVDNHHSLPHSWCDENDIARDQYDTIINKTPISYKTHRMIGG